MSVAPTEPGAAAGAPPRVAILIPCFNEEPTIGKVVGDFRRALPSAQVIVYDNNSTDRTVEAAREAGAEVTREPRQGKGNVVRAMFDQVEADVYVLVDGDDTYSAADVERLIEPVVAGRADMAVASRLKTAESSAFRPLHALGNWGLTQLFNLLFGARLSDMLSGYRALSRRAVKGMRLQSGGFDVETELNIRVLEAGYAIAEVPLPYGSRPQGSVSKLNTVRDGLRVLRRLLFGGRRGRRIVLIAALVVVGLAGLLL